MTCRYLIGLGIAVFRRAALQDIADVHILALEIDGFYDFRQQLPGTSDEWEALLIFVETGCFTDEHEFGIRIPGTEYDVRPLRRELATLAVPDFGADGFERHDGFWDALRYGLRVYIERLDTDIPKEFELGSKVIGIHLSNSTTRSRI